MGILIECFDKQERFWAIPFFIAFLVVVGGVLGLFLTAEMSREPTRRSQCSNNLKQIGIALHSYHDTYGSLPPPYITDDEGRAIHSWRVLVLPFLEQQPLYDQYRFDEPWNGPHNIQLVEKMPAVFHCPSNRGMEKTYTANYVAVIGPETAWPGDRPVRMRDIVDGTSNTWLVVEAADSGIAWTEPRDLQTLQMPPEINPPAGQGISSKHPGGAQVVYADGSAHFVRETLSLEDVYTWLTIDDGEPVDSDW